MRTDLQMLTFDRDSSWKNPKNVFSYRLHTNKQSLQRSSFSPSSYCNIWNRLPLRDNTDSSTWTISTDANITVKMPQQANAISIVFMSGVYEQVKHLLFLKTVGLWKLHLLLSDTFSGVEWRKYSKCLSYSSSKCTSMSRSTQQLHIMTRVVLHHDGC